jgi:D-glycero-D-manno-heptose 1,7-bisphosphate phosphatase
MILKNLNIDKRWSLFLDRDGVINERLIGDYVKNWEEFKFLPGSIEAIAKASEVFGRIVVVTNQQGIAKGLYSAEDLLLIHNQMIAETNKAGGRIDAVYFAPALASENSNLRKPATGMALQAKAEFPEIDFSKSIMVGDSESDIVFGNTLGMFTVFISGQNQQPENTKADMVLGSLKEFGNVL